jgi:hypothetical protein
VDLSDRHLVDRRFGDTIRYEFQSAHQAVSAAHIADERVLLHECFEPFEKLGAAHCGVVLDLKALDFLEAGDRGSRSDGVARMGVA